MVQREKVKKEQKQKRSRLEKSDGESRSVNETGSKVSYKQEEAKGKDTGSLSTIIEFSPFFCTHHRSSFAIVYLEAF